MEKEALTEKEKYLIILLCVLGAASAFYTGICHYAGWIGKMEYFQYQFIIVAGKDVFSAPLVSSQRTCRAASCFVRIWDLSDKNKEKTVWNADIMAGFVLLAQYAFYPWFWNAVDYDGGNRRIVCICKCSANDWESDCPKPYIRSFRFGKRPRGIMQTEAEKDGVDLFLSSEKDTGCRCMAVLSVCGFCRSDCIFSGTEDGRHVVYHFVSCYCSLYS